MFTTEPTLSQRIQRMFGETPIVDSHTHIHGDHPGARNLADLLLVQELQAELRSCGMPVEELNPELPTDERVRHAIPFLKRMRNTTTAWCFYRILRDLYDFQDHHLTDANYLDLCATVETTARDPAWATNILRDRCHIETVVTSLGNTSAEPGKTPANFFFRLDLDDLFCPASATDLSSFLDSRNTRGDYYAALEARFKDRPASAPQLAKLLRDWLGRTFTGPVRFSSTFLPIDQRFTSPDITAASKALARAASGTQLNYLELDEVVRLVTWEVLGWHNDHARPLQLEVGFVYPTGAGRGIPRDQASWMSDMARAFRHFGTVRFDLVPSSEPLSHAATALARELPNVYLTGYGQPIFCPGTIETLVSQRIQLAPMTKLGGFLSGASSVEWVYGKLQVVKKATAAALAHLVANGYYEEDELPPILHQILHDTPVALHGLEPR